MRLVIVHYHLRPGGIRRVIELAAPHLVREAPRPVTRVTLLTGQAADERWRSQFVRQLRDVPVEFIIEPACNYFSEQRSSPGRIAEQIRHALEKVFAGGRHNDTIVWAHNLGVGRNLILSRELAAACAAHGVPLVSHHHDWWFDNRWLRWPEMRAAGFRTLAAAARSVFPPQGRVLHAAINATDAAILSRHFGSAACWLPNLTEPAPLPPATRIRAARRWLAKQLGNDHAPVWLLPARALRRKNITEALLLTRWLRPGAWLVVTGAASSADEAPYVHALERAARRHHWPLRLGVLVGAESSKPTVAELFAASEAVLLASAQEGFGLPYLEAAAAQRPLIARRLPNIAPDLDRFGFRFPQAYDEILIAPELFDWKAERARQKQLFREWRATLPARARSLAAAPIVLTGQRVRPVPFSRLTLTAQLEVLAHPAVESWKSSAPLNPFLADWRRRAETGALRVTPWPRSAKHWLGGAAYAQRFFAALGRLPKVGRVTPCAPGSSGTFSPAKIQADFFEGKLSACNLYPLLLSRRT